MAKSIDTSDGEMVKLILEEDGDVETLWAERLPNGHFRLDNAPFFFYGASADDVLEAVPEPETTAMYRFVRVLERSGNYTIRIFSKDLDIAGQEFEPVLSRLRELGCTYEGFPPRLLSVTIPAELDKEPVLEYLNEAGLTWEFGNPRYAELYGEDPD